MTSAIPLVEVRRGGRLESVHAGWFAIADAAGNLLAASGSLPAVFPRSAAKPFQALPLIDTGAADALDLGGEELALCAASHAAEPVHLAGVARILERSGYGPADLRCGAHAPLADPCEPSSLLANNCSGKHAGMLAACRHNGWEAASYLDPGHPLQQAVRARLEDLAGMLVGGAIDGCGVPAWHLPLESLAAAYARLPADPAGARILAAMGAHPHLVAGTGRRDTVLMQVTGGRLVSKGGAEGVSAGCDLGRGIGWALKISDGHSRAVGPALVRLLECHELLTAAEASHLASLARPELFNHAGTAVGELAPAF